MIRALAIFGALLASGAAFAQQQPVGGAGAFGGPIGAGNLGAQVQGTGLGTGALKPRSPTGTATKTGAESAGGVPNGPNSPSTDEGNAGAGGGVSPAQQ